MIKKKILQLDEILNQDVPNPLWLSVSEISKLCGVQTKTIRRAVQAKEVKYKIIKNRYLIEFASAVLYLHKNTKLKNKFYSYGLGQYFVSQKAES
jgi:hypothetical protein